MLMPKNYFSSTFSPMSKIKDYASELTIKLVLNVPGIRGLKKF